MDNKHMVHVATETVALVAITLYFSGKNKKLMRHIEELSIRLEDHDDMLAKHELLINTLMESTNLTQESPPKPVPVQVPVPVVQPPVRLETIDEDEDEDESESDEDMPDLIDVVEEEDLDSELQDEISELKQKT